MPADRPACHYSTNAAWDTSSPYWGQTEQAWVSRWQTLTLVWNDFAIAYFHIQYCLTFCKWQLVINWHHGSIKAGCVHPAASREPSWRDGKRKRCSFFPPEQNRTAHGCELPDILLKLSHSERRKKSTIFSAERVSVGHIVKRFKSKWKLWSRIQIQQHSHLVEDSMNTPADDDKDRPTITTITNYFYNRLISLSYCWQ